MQRKLNTSGAVLVRGAKSCGKTESTKQVAGTILQVDQDEQVAERKQKAQFILTGSSNPEESVKMHSGAGGFTILIG